MNVPAEPPTATTPAEAVPPAPRLPAEQLTPAGPPAGPPASAQPPASVEPLPPGDAELLAATKAGDSAAYATLYERHAAAARGLARQLVRGQAEADDVVAETFAKVLDLLRRGGGPQDAFRPYLLTAVRRTAYDRHRAERRQVLTDEMEAFDPGIPFADPAVAELERTMIARAFASLPERWRAVLWHTEIEGAKPAEVASLLGLTANGVAALAYRAREGLRQAYLQMHLSGAVREECRPVAAKLGAYVRGGLAKRDAAAVGAHLDECEDCREVLAELGDANVALRGVIAPLILGPAAAAYLASMAAGGAAAGGAASAGAAGGSAGGGAAGGTGAGGVAARLARLRQASKGQQAAVAGVAAAAVVGLAAAAMALTANTGHAPGQAAGHRSLPPAAAAPAPAGAPAPPSSPSRHHARTSPGSPGAGPAAPGTPGSGSGSPGSSGSGSAGAGSAGSGSSGSGAPGRGSPPAAATPPAARASAPPSSTSPSSASPPGARPAPQGSSAPAPTEPAANPAPIPLVAARLATTINPVGALPQGGTGIVAFSVSNTGSGPAAQVEADVTLPAGVSLLAAGSLGQDVLDQASPGGWTCTPTASGASCTHGSIAAGSSTTSYLSVAVADDAPTGTPPAISVGGGGRTVSARGTAGVSTTGLAARYAASGRYAVVTAHGTAARCTAGTPWPGETEVSSCPAGSSDLVLPGRVTWAGLYWAWSGYQVQAPIALRGPGGSYQQVSGATSAAADMDLPGGAVHQAFANVTSQVARYGTGTWSAAARGAGSLGTGDASYLGWTLVVVAADRAAPSRQVIVLDGAQQVDWVEPDFTAPLGGLPAGRSAKVQVVTWTYRGPKAKAFTQPLTGSPAVNFVAGSVPYLVGVIAATAAQWSAGL